MFVLYYTLQVSFPSLEGSFHTGCPKNLKYSDCFGWDGVHSKFMNDEELNWMAWWKRTLTPIIYCELLQFSTIYLGHFEMAIGQRLIDIWSEILLQESYFNDLKCGNFPAFAEY